MHINFHHQLKLPRLGLYHNVEQTPGAASFPDVSLTMEIRAPRTLSSFSFLWSLALRHQSLAFRARLCSRLKCETKRLRSRQPLEYWKSLEIIV